MDVDKLETLCFTVGNVKWCGPYGKQHAVTQKIDTIMTI